MALPLNCNVGNPKNYIIDVVIIFNFADKLITDCSSKQILNKVLLFGSFDLIFDFIH